jgi:hypothetical protein
MYALAAGQRGRTAILVFRLEDPDAAAKKLQGRGVRILSREEVLARVAA